MVMNTNCDYIVNFVICAVLIQGENVWNSPIIDILLVLNSEEQKGKKILIHATILIILMCQTSIISVIMSIPPQKKNVKINHCKEMCLMHVYNAEN